MSTDAVPAVQTVGVSRRFGPVQAIDQIGLTVPSGVVYGFLGPNGAGKTTTLRILTALLRPDTGSVRLFGEPVQRGAAVLRRIGAAIERPAFYPYLSGRANLEVFGLVGAFRYRDPRAIDAVIDRVGLREAASRPFGTYSTGMKQRLAIGLAILGEPALVILDEPTSGLDPEGIVAVRELVQELQAQGATVVLSSHQLGEVERVCSWVGVVVRGRLIAQGAVDELLGQPETRLELASKADRERARELLAGAGASPADRPSGADEGTSLVLRSGATNHAVARLLADHGIYPTELAVRRRSLESLFLELTSAVRSGTGGGTG
ncbi:MAG: ATP-binding cassette domain-containing protein [Chloroflexota bacterium]